MSYRTWPAALLAGASLATAALVVGDHVVASSDRCLDAAGWFTASPVARTQIPDLADSGEKPTAGSGKVDVGAPGAVDPVGQSRDQRDTGHDRISGCLDLDRIEVPPPVPAPDGRA
ncbi:MAG: hypothetical protein H0U22_09090 [Geodermatophilaceae bacterium]|nr:hypothetical protein [Geodermatophilaceae bacterium]